MITENMQVSIILDQRVQIATAERDITELTAPIKDIHALLLDSVVIRTSIRTKRMLSPPQQIDFNPQRNAFKS